MKACKDRISGLRYLPWHSAGGSSLGQVTLVEVGGTHTKRSWIVDWDPNDGGAAWDPFTPKGRRALEVRVLRCDTSRLALWVSFLVSRDLVVGCLEQVDVALVR